MPSEIIGIQEELNELNVEFLQLKNLHRTYTEKVEDVKKIQNKCLSAIVHQNSRMKIMTHQLEKYLGVLNIDKDEGELVLNLKREIHSRILDCNEMSQTLPSKNGVYLSIILGQVNVSLLNKIDKFAYKKDYEKFKMIVNVISFIFSFMLFFFWSNRVFDALFQFLLVWYYCTLTIREHILIQNGSRIKGWWIAHHFVSTFLSGVVLVWPRSYSYYQFRDQFNFFCLYMSIAQIIQCYYQQGCLYKLRALGERHSMDITIDGFMSWMWKRLTFIIPFLIVAYLFQLYNAYVLYVLYIQPSTDAIDNEWQVIALAATFFVLFCGNSLTLAGQLQVKLAERGGFSMSMVSRQLRKKYRFFGKRGRASISLSNDSNVNKTTENVIREETDAIETDKDK